MTTSSPTLEGSAAIGANIMAAARVMRATHVETSALLGLFDELMIKHEYASAHVSSRNWVGLQQNGAQVGNPNNWMATSVQRAYAERQALSRHAVIFEVHLLPDRYEQPVLATLALRFGEPVAARGIWDAWDRDRSGSWLSGGLGDVTISDDRVRTLFRGLPIDGVRGRVIPLCELEKAMVSVAVVGEAMAIIGRLASEP